MKDSLLMGRVVAAAAAGAGALGLAGCGASLAPSAVSPAEQALKGKVHGGQQPVNGGKVYLYAISTGATAAPAVSILNGSGYVLTDAGGNFSITGDYTCPAGSLVYLLATGGNPGMAAGTNNPELVLAAGVGPCSSLQASSYFTINEVTTVAMAYALAAFATSETTVYAPPSLQGGLVNAFGNIPNMVDPANGIARGTTPAGNGVVPASTINSLANSLAACVNSDGTGVPCANLMAAANVSGAGGTAVDTFQAALNIAHNPGVNVSAVYMNSTPNAPFQPSLSSAPNDWTLTVAYSGEPNPLLATSPNKCYDPYPNGGPFTDICQGQGMAIDAGGNIWVDNYNPDANGGNGAVSYEQGNVVKFSPAGAEISPPGGYTAPYFHRLQQMAIDMSGNAWVGSRVVTVGGTSYPDNLVRINPSGVVSDFTGGGIFRPRGVAVDYYQNVWTAGPGVLAEFTNDGTPVSGSGYQSSTLPAGTFEMNFDNLGNAWIVGYDNNYVGNLVEFTPLDHASNMSGAYGGFFNKNLPTNGTIDQGMAIDQSNNIWYSSAFTSSDSNGNVSGTGFVGEYSNSGTLLSGSGYTIGGISNPNNVAIDGSGHVLVVNENATISELTNGGTAISPSTGYAVGYPSDCCFVSAVDESGNLWLTGGVGLYQMIGIATPVLTPAVATLPAPAAASARKK